MALSNSHYLYGQAQCTGSLGANLFEQGDFGSGSRGILSEDPKIAPGYSYEFLGPPSDGEYMITNDVNSWSSVYDTWLRIRDNSTDPFGYMMVVNASFEPGLFYEEEITDICENTQFEFTADIINMIRTGVSDHSDPNVAFLIDDLVVLQTGDIPKDERWHTYSFSFTTVPGQSTVKLSLRNNAPGGTGNDLALDNITFRACGPPSKVTSNTTTVACLEDFPMNLTAQIDGAEDPSNYYTWEYTNSDNPDWQTIAGANSSQLTLDSPQDGAYNYRFGFAGSAANFDNAKCRFYSEPIQIIIPQREFVISDTICGGTGINIDGLEITSPGIYVSNLISSQGCDSIITYILDTIQRATIDARLNFGDPLCFGEASGTLMASDIDMGYPPYHLNIDGVDYPALSYDMLTAGRHDIKVVDKYGCFYEEAIELSDPPEFIIDIGQDQSLLLGEEAIVAVSANQMISTINFEPSIDSSSPSLKFQFLPLQNMTVSAIATSEGGCTDEDAFTITVDQDIRIYIPNAFSPNGDNKNDKFQISAFGKSLAYIEQLDIWSRWGEKISTSTDIGGWDGTNGRGEDLASGIYLYQLKAVLINGQSIEQTGSLSLIR